MQEVPAMHVSSTSSLGQQSDVPDLAAINLMSNEPLGAWMPPVVSAALEALPELPAAPPGLNLVHVPGSSAYQNTYICDA